MQKRIIVSCLFLCCTFMLSAQLTYGTTGLLHTPSAEMQKDKTVMVLPYVQLLPECNHHAMAGSSIHLYAF